MIQQSFSESESACVGRTLTAVVTKSRLSHFASDADSMFEPNLGNGAITADSNPESYFFYAPLIKALLDKYAVYLDVERLAPHLSHKSAKFIGEFQSYLTKHPEEWRANFLGNVSGAIFEALATGVPLFWDDILRSISVPK